MIEMSERSTDWYSIAQAAAGAAQEIAEESTQHRIELIRLRNLNQGKDNQIEILENIVNAGRNRMKVLLDKIEFLQDMNNELEFDLRETVSVALGGAWSAIVDINVNELRKECGCGSVDPG